MRKIIFGMFVFMSVLSLAQEKTKEPTFIGEAFILKGDKSIIKLEKNQVSLETKAGFSLYVGGIGKVKTKLRVPNCCSSASYKAKDEIKIVVRAVDNESDPLSIIEVFKFQRKKKKRLAELSSIGTFSGASSNNLDYLKFSAEKYGEKSYILTINNFERDKEYGIIVSNPNALDQKNIIVSTFSIQ